jgi:hypothetical protein
MESKEGSSPRYWRVEDILGHLNDNVDKNNAEELLHCILTSTEFSHRISRVLYAHGQIFIQIVKGVTVRSVIFDCPKEISRM